MVDASEAPGLPAVTSAHLAHILNPVDCPPAPFSFSSHKEIPPQCQLAGDELSPQTTARWDADARHRHSRACSGKTRLSIQDKLDIICLYYSSDAIPSSSRRTVHQWDIALRYGKSRAAISKLLKPEHARKVIMSAEGGR
eukprot:762629-Hanusia_phi.AAC.1